MAGVRERAVGRALAPLLPVLAAARRVGRLPTMNCSGRPYQERREALADLRDALRAYDEATR
jgi:hypothetical protein